MSSLLHIASRIEAAANSYRSVQDTADKAEWRRHFDQEKALAKREVLRLETENKVAPALHPTLAALFIVLKKEYDLSEISRDYPKVKKHQLYRRDVEFPQDISNLLPPSEDRWWEHLAAKSQAPAHSKIKFVFTAVPDEPDSAEVPDESALAEVPDEPASAEVEEDEEEIDELEDDDIQVPTRTRHLRNRDKGKKTALAIQLRKRKGSSPPPRKTTKRHAGPSRQKLGTPKNSDEDMPSAIDATPYNFECDRCVNAKVTCEPDPVRPCKRCRVSKLGCSLLPRNKTTGKPDRRHLSAKVIHKFRVDQYNERHAVRGRLTKQAGSGSGTSRSTLLSPLDVDVSSHSPPGPSDSPTPATGSESSAIVPPELPSLAVTSGLPVAAASSSAATFYVEVPAVAAALPLSTSSVADVRVPASAPPSMPPLIPQLGPAVAPALRRHIGQTSSTLRTQPPPPSSTTAENQQLPAARSLDDRIQSLERRMEAIEEWKQAMEEWKQGIDKTVQRARR